MSTIAELQSRFGIAGAVDIRAGRNGLPLVAVKTPIASAEIYLHGAHLTHYQLQGQAPLLFMSEKSMFQEGKAIRGGVPIIFPWFGPSKTDPKAPQHGFARSLPWTLKETSVQPDGSVRVSLSLSSDAQTRQWWPHDFALDFRLTVGPALVMELDVRNPGDKPMTFEEALHTYLAVADIRRVGIEGLAGRTYLDKTLNMARIVQAAAPLCIEKETDSHYLASPDTVTVTDPVGRRRIVVEKQGSNVTVVWNPWDAKAKAMSDFGDDEWPRMLCIETANAHDYPVTLPPGGVHAMQARIHAE